MAIGLYMHAVSYVSYVNIHNSYFPGVEATPMLCMDMHV